MRKNIPAIIVVSMMVVLVLCSACVFSPAANQTQQQDRGLSQITIPAESSRISFNDAYRKLKEYQTVSVNGSVNDKTIYYILGKDMDESGNAMSWVFGVKNTTGNQLFIYNGKSMMVIPWIITTPPSEEIVVDQIISPYNLFDQNRKREASISTKSATIPERQDLELQKGIYKLTRFSGRESRILSFNATTGALIT